MHSFLLTLIVGVVGCLQFCSAECPTSGVSLDLNQFAGKWFLVGGTPVNGNSLSKCGTFQVKKTSSNTFVAKYTASSHRDNSPVTFNIDGRIAGEVIGNWQLEGSKKILGPFKHVVVSADYGSYIVMVVCSENTSSYLPRHKFSMIWSRERTLPRSDMEDLKTTLSGYIRKDDILLADQANC